MESAYQALTEVDSAVHITDNKCTTRCGQSVTAVNDTEDPIVDKPGCITCESTASGPPLIEAGDMSTSDGLCASC